MQCIGTISVEFISIEKVDLEYFLIQRASL